MHRVRDALSGQSRDMETDIISRAVAAVGGLITAFMNFFTDMFLTPPLKATLKRLEEAELRTLKGGNFFSIHLRR